MFKLYRYFFVFMLVFSACSKDEVEDAFTSDVDTSVTTEDIIGTWFVYAGEYMDNFFEITPNFPECGFDYLVFADNDVYQEVVYSESDCVPFIAFADWKLENGIITVLSTNGERLELPVLDYGPSHLVVNLRYDLDNDGEDDIFKAHLKPYNPITNYHVAKSFVRDSDETSLLKFNWKQETNVSSFSKYEVYRSQEGTCSKEDAILLAEINDISNTSFVDYNPPPTQGNLCYFLRVYSSNGLVGESQLLSENPKELIIPSAVNLNSVYIEDESIIMEWEDYSIPYFSHYEVVYANSGGSNTLFHEEDIITLIHELEETSFLNTDPPYLENPFFAIYAYNIFGSKVVSNYEQVIFRREDLFGPISLGHLEVDDEESVVFLHGGSQIPDWASYDIGAVLRLNYNEGLIESTTSNEIYTGGEVPFRKPINFQEGRELVINGVNNMHFLNPTSLTENFSFPIFYLQQEFNLLRITDFTYTNNGFLVIIDNDSVFVFRRNGEQLILLDKQIHYNIHHGDNLYRMLHVNDNEIIVGHKNEETSILYKVNDNGLLENRRVVSLPLSSSYIQKYKNESFYSDSRNLLINYGDKMLYSTLSFQPTVQMPQDMFALGLDKQAKYIFATTNNPDWYGSDVQTEFLKREVLLFDTETSQITSIKTKGYPIRIFQNNLGEVFSISIPENQVITQFDIFVEKVDLP